MKLNTLEGRKKQILQKGDETFTFQELEPALLVYNQNRGCLGRFYVSLYEELTVVEICHVWKIIMYGMLLSMKSSVLSILEV